MNQGRYPDFLHTHTLLILVIIDLAVSDIILEGPNKVSVTLNNEKWKVVNSLRVFQNSYEEVMLMKPGNILSRPKIKTVICESETPFAEKYGEKGKLLAAAECIADFESSKFNNKKPGLIKKITSFLNNA